MSNLQDRKFKCWAATCGGCGEGPSREHLVSDCLFPAGSVHVSGFDWCKGETKSIGVNGLARHDAKLVYRPLNIATASNDMPISMIRLKW